MHQSAGRERVLATEPTDITAACEAFVLSLMQGRYYDAHEDFERIWHPRRFEECDEVLLWKGFINAAVSFELMRRGRAEAAKRVWKNYRKYVLLLDRLATPDKELYVTIVQTIEHIKATHV